MEFLLTVSLFKSFLVYISITVIYYILLLIVYNMGKILFIVLKAAYSTCTVCTRFDFKCFYQNLLFPSGGTLRGQHKVRKHPFFNYYCKDMFMRCDRCGVKLIFRDCGDSRHTKVLQLASGCYEVNLLQVCCFQRIGDALETF